MRHYYGLIRSVLNKFRNSGQLHSPLEASHGGPQEHPGPLKLSEKVQLPQKFHSAKMEVLSNMEMTDFHKLSQPFRI